jgi:hypothetical protein
VLATRERGREGEEPAMPTQTMTVGVMSGTQMGIDCSQKDLRNLRTSAKLWRP